MSQLLKLNNMSFSVVTVMMMLGLFIGVVKKK